MSNTEKFETWAIVEIMGHQSYAGFLSEREIAGQSFLQLDVPAILDDEPAKARAAFTKILGTSSIYSITPVSEEVARHAVESMGKRPLNTFHFPFLQESQNLIDYGGGDSEEFV